jgi:serine/threonine protein kinase
MTDKNPYRSAEGPPGSGSGLASRSTAPTNRRPAYQHPQQIGRYEVHADPEITDSSFVYEGWDPVLERKVAIKAMRLSDGDEDEIEEARLRFQRSARAAGTFHPNIVSVYDYLEEGGSAYIVMEFVEGGSLKGRIDQRLPFKRAEIAAIMSDLFAALSYSHRMGIIHRDIKPANILLSNEGRWKLTDFGIARFRSSVATRVGTFMGTPAYSSLEQVRTEPVDNRTDIYSCGVVLYELLTGQRPFRGSEETVRRKIQEEIPPPPSSVNSLWSTQLDRVVAKAMAKRRDDRFKTVEDFQAALQQAISVPLSKDAEDGNVDSTVFFRPEHRLTSGAARVAKRVSYPLLAGVAGAVLLLGGGFFVLRTLTGHPQQNSATTRPAEAPTQRVTAPVPATPSALPRADTGSAPEPTAPPANDPNAQIAYAADRPGAIKSPVAEPPPAPDASVPTSQPVDQPVEPPPAPLPYQPPALAVPSYRPEPAPPPPQPAANPQATRQQGIRMPKVVEKPPASPEKPQPDRRLFANGTPNAASELRQNENRPNEARQPYSKLLALGRPAAPTAPVEPPPQPAAPSASARDIGVFCGPIAADTPHLPESTDPSTLLRVIGAAQGLAGFNAGIRTGDVLAKGGGLLTRGDGYSSCLVSPASGNSSVAVRMWREGHWRTVSVQAN